MINYPYTFILVLFATGSICPVTQQTSLQMITLGIKWILQEHQENPILFIGGSKKFVLVPSTQANFEKKLIVFHVARPLILATECSISGCL